MTLPRPFRLLRVMPCLGILLTASALLLSSELACDKSYEVMLRVYIIKQTSPAIGWSGGAVICRLKAR